jgi:RNA polymerase sigma-70 factor (ECF subfamily)
MSSEPSAPDSLELERHRPYLLRFALLQLRDRSAAEDAVQETLLAAIQGASRFAGQSSVRTWLVGILKHKIIDGIRRSAREQPAGCRL